MTLGIVQVGCRWVEDDVGHCRISGGSDLSLKSLVLDEEALRSVGAFSLLWVQCFGIPLSLYILLT